MSASAGEERDTSAPVGGADEERCVRVGEQRRGALVLHKLLRVEAELPPHVPRLPPATPSPSTDFPHALNE